MNASLDHGWSISHLTDRTVELRKDDIAYRQITGKPGFVLHRAEPGTSRDDLIQGAMGIAMQNDSRLADMIARQLIPSKRATKNYEEFARRFEPVFGIPGDNPEEKRQGV